MKKPYMHKKLEKVMEKMSKEKSSSYVIPLPCWLDRFIPHLFFTPQHNLEKQGKKYGLIYNAAEHCTKDSI